MSTAGHLRQLEDFEAHYHYDTTETPDIPQARAWVARSAALYLRQIGNLHSEYREDSMGHSRRRDALKILGGTLALR
jgi:hypothetical protein